MTDGYDPYDEDPYRDYPYDDQFLPCGAAYDHTLNLIDERDGQRTYECSECGAEIIEEDE